MKTFCHLHNHTSYSALDGAAKIEDLVLAAKADGQSSLGITDHGVLWGLVDFYKTCKKHDVNPVLGIESYFADDRFDRTPKGKGHSDLDGSDKRYYHLTVLAENNVGYSNLIKLSSDAFLEGFYHKPRADWDLLEKYSDGLIATSGCLGGPVLQELLHDRFDAALDKASRLQDIFGKDSFFIELQNHGLVEQVKTNPQLIEISRKINAPLIATNDLHYVNHDDHIGHDALLCQPPGTLVQIVGLDGSFYEKKIEDIQVNDTVRSWISNQRRGRMRETGSLVTKIGSRQYNGDLVVAHTDTGRSSRYTTDHICAARIDADLSDGNYIVYLMSDKDNRFRIGTTQWRKTYSNHTLGPIVRTKEENGDSVWILGIYETDHEARKNEAFKSWKYGIPTWSFGNPKKSAHKPRTPYYVDLWNMVGSLRHRAIECLTDHGKDINYPLWSRRETGFNQRTPNFIRACNLESGMMVCEPDSRTDDGDMTGSSSGAWHSISVSREYYDGIVYSMDVDEDQTYVADGIVTHNCCQTGSKLSDENRFRFQSDQHYLKSSAEMRHLFMDVPDACDNTLLIAERSDVNIDFDTLHLPVFDVPDGYDSATSYLSKLAIDGLHERYGTPSDDHYARLSYELSVIDSMGLSSYFLIVWDLQRFADRQGIRRGPARGSAAGSIVSYCLDITKVDPLRHGLIFERFLNPGRIALPDIDLDYDSRYRDSMINYVVEKYGSEHVAQIITFNIIRARAAVRDAARVLGYAPAFADKISKAMPPLVMGENTPLDACFNYSARYDIGYHNAAGLREMYDSNADVKKVVDVAKSLEGLVRQDGIHAAGIVITPDPITEYVPVQRRGDGPVVTQYEKGAVEDLGLLKMDFLGLRTLDVISDCVELIGFDPVTESDSFDDLKTFDLLKSGNTVGVFQLESLPMRKLLKRLQPNSIDDIAAVVALYRPGPMAENMHNDYADRKNGRQGITYFHEDAEPILKQTLGLCIYQESVLEIAKKFAGYSLTEADLLRKVMGKKLVDKMVEERSKFTDGCVANGYDAVFASKLFDMIEAFSRYSFNSSHAYSYAYLSYYTAFLKANYPKEFMAALCSSMIQDIDRCGFYLNEAKDMNLTVYSPDVNRSSTFFTVEDDGIRIGLASIRNVGEVWASEVLSEREANGAFSSLTNFVERVEPNSRSFMFLSYSGALDSFGSRLGVSTAIPEILKMHRKQKKKIDSGQDSLFDTHVEYDISDVEFSEIEFLNNEYDALGLYVSGHPLDAYADKMTGELVADLQSVPEGESVSVLVLVNDVKVKQTKSGQRMAVVSVQDKTGFVDCVIFPKKFSSIDNLASGDIGVLILRVGSDFNDQRNFVFTDFSKVGSAVVEESDVADFKIFLPQGFANSDDSVKALKRLLSLNYGWTPVTLHVSKSTVLKLPRSFSVSLNDDLISSIGVLFREYSSR